MLASFRCRPDPGRFLPSLTAFLIAAGASACGPPYDLVIEGGRVMDPESGLDAVRNVGIVDGRVATISVEPLEGARHIQAVDLVVAVVVESVAELIGRTISIQTAPDVESATRCQVMVSQAGIVQNLVSGPYTSLEDMLALQS